MPKGKDLKTGDAAPAFSLPTDGGGNIGLKDFKDRYLVLFFYPKNDTPGCTVESCGFRDSLDYFNDLGCAVVGISKDSAKSHDKFKHKYSLNFPLASDEFGSTCEDYGVWVEKSMYGRKYMGIERSTFLIDPKGKIAGLWRKVSVDAHVEEVRKMLEGVKKAA